MVWRLILVHNKIVWSMKAKFSTQKNSLKAKFGANKIPGSMKSKFGTQQNTG